MTLISAYFQTNVLPQVYPYDPALPALLSLYGRRATFTAYCLIDGGQTEEGKLPPWYPLLHEDNIELSPQVDPS